MSCALMIRDDDTGVVYYWSRRQAASVWGIPTR